MEAPTGKSKIHYFSTRMNDELKEWLEAIRADMGGIGDTPLFRQLIHEEFKRRKLKSPPTSARQKKGA